MSEPGVTTETPDDAETRARFSPSRADVSVWTKGREHLELLRAYVEQARAGHDFAWLADDLEAYDRLMRTHAGRPLAGSTIFEIGFGQRPYRLQTLLGMGLDATGIDMEVPILRGSVREYAATLRANGAERAAKSIVRHTLFDRRERARLKAFLGGRGITAVGDPSRFLVGDATKLDLDRRFDLIISEDVFEHVDAETLPHLVARMAGWLAPDGIALIRPNVFTGITGGHLTEWNRWSFEHGRKRRSEPWDHLRAREFRPNTFLNELTRADYRRLFGEHFEIVAEEVSLPDLGRDLLTGRVAEDLAGWDEEELFSNQVRFVLRARRDGAGVAG